MKESNSQAFRRGFRDGIPIGLGYLAVSFSIGIAARNIGLNAFQGFLMSLLNNASAGEYAGLTVIAANSPYIEVAIVTLITNARYLLMSCAMSQRLSPDLSLGHRLLMSYDITDELFGIAISRPGTLNPYYTYGAMVTPLPGWAFELCSVSLPEISCHRVWSVHLVLPSLECLSLSSFLLRSRIKSLRDWLLLHLSQASQQLACLGSPLCRMVPEQLY